MLATSLRRLVRSSTASHVGTLTDDVKRALLVTLSEFAAKHRERELEENLK
jgi:hypothetical protein